MFVKTNTVKAIIDYYHQALEGIYSASEINVLLEIVFEHFVGYNKLDLKTKTENRLSESELLDFHFTLKRLKTKEPIQYILGEAPFLGMMLKVDSNVLIPRPETEELVDLVLQTITNKSGVLDIGTGSGCIPLAIKKFKPETEVYALDLDEHALTIAKDNGKKMNLDVSFSQLDILKCESLEEIFHKKFDCIISNPPYIKNSEKKEMESQVLDFEPHLALFVNDTDPLLFYKKITVLAFENLNKEGYLFFESNQKYADDVAVLMKETGFKDVIIKLDINSNPRMIYGKRP